MKKSYLSILVLLIFAFIIESCNQESVNPSKANLNNSTLPLTLLFGLPDSVKPDYLLAFLSIGSYESYDTDLGLYVTTKSAYSYFAKPNYQYTVNAGIVTLNSYIIPKYSVVSQTSSDSLYSYSSNYNFNFGGINYTWNVSGSNDFPLFAISVNSPASKVQITLPSRNQVVSKSSNLTINWNGIHSLDNKVRISINSSVKGFSKFVDDTGSYTLTSAELSELSAGAGTVQIACGRYTILPIPGITDRYAIAIIHSSFTQDIIIQ